MTGQSDTCWPFAFLPFFSFLASLAIEALPQRRALGTLALEDPPDERLALALGDGVEDQADVAAVGAARDACLAAQRIALGQLERHFDDGADLGRAGAGDEQPAAADVEREGVQRRVLVRARRDDAGDRRGDADVLAAL